MGVAELTRRVDFLEGVIDRLQEALGVQVEVEAKSTNKLKTKVNFSVTLGGGVWEDAKKHPEISDAIHTTIKYKLEKLLKEGKNGWVEEVDKSKTRPL